MRNGYYFIPSMTTMNRLLLLLCLLSGLASAQRPSQAVFKNNVFLELLGNGGYASVNYEHNVFHLRNINIYPSIGIGTFKTKDFTGSVNPDVFIPLGLRLYYGVKHTLVIGIGQTVTSAVRLNNETFSPDRDYDLSANLMLGYRINFRRINLQLAYTPILENYDKYINWLGLAIGYKF